MLNIHRLRPGGGMGVKWVGIRTIGQWQGSNWRDCYCSVAKTPKLSLVWSCACSRISCSTTKCEFSRVCLWPMDCVSSLPISPWHRKKARLPFLPEGGRRLLPTGWRYCRIPSTTTTTTFTPASTTSSSFPTGLETRWAMEDSVLYLPQVKLSCFCYSYVDIRYISLLFW